MLVERPEGKGQLGRPGHRRKENIKMDIQELELAGMDWIDQVHDRDKWQVLVNVLVNLWVS